LAQSELSFDYGIPIHADETGACEIGFRKEALESQPSGSLFPTHVPVSLVEHSNDARQKSPADGAQIGGSKRSSEMVA
jgi:hypothetical protein